MQNKHSKTIRNYESQINTRNRYKPILVTISLKEPILDYVFPSSMRRSSDIWQITFPLCIVLLAAITSLTTYSIVKGRYLFDLSISQEQLRIRTDLDIKESIRSAE